MEADDYIALSYLLHYSYCPRRAGLLMLEQAWVDNEYTAWGTAEHAHVHMPDAEKRGQTVKLFEFTVQSHALQLSGKCDLIEAREAPIGCRLPGQAARYTLKPVEFKHGVVRPHVREYHIQLCAQAMCLEEMFCTAIGEGDIFYISAHRRDTIAFSEALRNDVVLAAQALHHMQRSGSVPPAVYSARCKKCSMLVYCEPKVKASAGSYCRSVWAAVRSNEGGEA